MRGLQTPTYRFGRLFVTAVTALRRVGERGIQRVLNSFFVLESDRLVVLGTTIVGGHCVRRCEPNSTDEQKRFRGH